MKDFIFACNFKMNEVGSTEYKKVFKEKTYSNLILCPSFCDIKDYVKLAKKFKFNVGAQDVCEYQEGAHTGCVSAKMLKNLGVDYCIVGHSERKKYNYETLQNTHEKVSMLLENDITPIICVGEELNQKYDQTEYAKRFVLNELNTILAGVDLNKVIVAYEPVWAIGSGKTASIKHIEGVTQSIKKYTGIKTVLYGGSFNDKNHMEIQSIKSLDGALIGSASLHPEIIIKMIDGE